MNAIVTTHCLLFCLFLLTGLEVHSQEGRPRRGGFGGPFGGSEPVDWQQRRQALLGKYDADKNGVLSDAEREAMRRARFKEAGEGGGGGGRGRGGFRMMMPPEVVKKYDLDRDGELNEKENQAAREGMQKQMAEVQAQYDEDKDGQLGETENAKVLKDIDSGKLIGLPRFMFGGGGRGGRGGPGGPGGFGGRGGRGGMFGGGEMPVDRRFVEADKDKNGRLSDEELNALRQKTTAPATSN